MPALSSLGVSQSAGPYGISLGVLAVHTAPHAAKQRERIGKLKPESSHTLWPAGAPLPIPLARNTGFRRAFELPAPPAALALQGVCLRDSEGGRDRPPTHFPASIFPFFLDFSSLCTTAAALRAYLGSQPERKKQTRRNSPQGSPTQVVPPDFHSLPNCHLDFSDSSGHPSAHSLSLQSTGETGSGGLTSSRSHPPVIFLLRGGTPLPTSHSRSFYS